MFFLKKHFLKNIHITIFYTLNKECNGNVLKILFEFYSEYSPRLPSGVVFVGVAIFRTDDLTYYCLPLSDHMD